jgi:hypothetical protein
MRRLLLPGLTGLAILLSPSVADAKKPADRNHDSIPDHWEVAHRVSVKKNLAKRDADKDGLSTFAEWRSHTDPRKADSDHDGTGDALEDRDHDGLANGFELLARTDPGSRDSDRDHRADGREDGDRDSLQNLTEARYGFAPNKADSDGDGTRDGDEQAGVITAVAGPVLTISLAKGGTLTAALHADSDVTCDTDPESWDDAEDPGADDGGDAADDPSADDGADNTSDDDGSDDGNDPSADEGDDATAAAAQAPDDAGDDAPADDCAAAIRPGALIHSLELTATPAGLLIDELELLAP